MRHYAITLTGGETAKFDGADDFLEQFNAGSVARHIVFRQKPGDPIDVVVTTAHIVSIRATPVAETKP